MKAQNYWQNFTNTGRIEDYLSYIDQQKKTLDDTGRQREDLGEHPGGCSYAGIHMCNRNDIEAGACRGI